MTINSEPRGKVAYAATGIILNANKGGLFFYKTIRRLMAISPFARPLTRIIDTKTHFQIVLLYSI